jgi:hypothetical protein
MGRYYNSGIGKGVGTSPQTTFENQEYENKVKEIEENNKNENEEKTNTSNLNNDKFDINKFSYSDSQTKIENYLLNLENEKGKSKAKFFIEDLGYSKNNPKEFFDNISNALVGKKPTRIENTNFGEVREFHEKIKGLNGKYEYANIVVIVQKDNGKVTYRIITAYPDKKEKK